MQGLGGTGAQQSKECAFQAGHIAGAPLRVSWFLVIFFVYQLIDAINAQGIPVWIRVVTVVVNEFLLLLTVLCHEMGHGTMARRCGGEIAEVLLWPFGGICFSTRAQGRSPRQKLVDDLWIVGAGPATHFPMAAIWVFLLASLATASSHVVMAPSWHHLIPFKQSMTPCINDQVDGCFHGYAGFLVYQFLVQAVQINVMLFMFNVFFPMYPMDGAKLIVCSLQLFCGTSAKCAAKVLVYTSAPLAVLFIANAFWGGMHGSGLQPGITAFMGFMCLSESYKIYTLMKEERLYTHPLFELARSSTREVNDSQGATTRLNASDRDDEESARAAAPKPFTELRAFSGAGHALGGGGSSSLQGTPASEGTEFQQLADGANQDRASHTDTRAKWLDRFERQASQREKSVRELEDERIERERLGSRQ